LFTGALANTALEITTLVEQGYFAFEKGDALPEWGDLIFFPISILLERFSSLSSLMRFTTAKNSQAWLQLADDCI